MKEYKLRTGQRGVTVTMELTDRAATALGLKAIRPSNKAVTPENKAETAEDKAVEAPAAAEADEDTAAEEEPSSGAAAAAEADEKPKTRPGHKRAGK